MILAVNACCFRDHIKRLVVVIRKRVVFCEGLFEISNVTYVIIYLFLVEIYYII